MKNENVINDVIDQLKDSKRFDRELAEIFVELNEAENIEIANRMGESIYCYNYWGNYYYFTMYGLIDDFNAYIQDRVKSLDDEYADMSLNDYVFHFKVKEYKPILP